MQELIHKIVNDFKIDIDERLFIDCINHFMILKNWNGATPSVQVEIKNRSKDYKITRDVAAAIINGKYIVGEVSDRPYLARQLDGYWLILDNY
jgi:hypothetical protein